MDFLSNLTNTTAANFFKSAASNIGSLFSSTASKATGFLGFGEGPKYPKATGIDKTFGLDSYGDFAEKIPLTKSRNEFLKRGQGMQNIDFNKYDSYQKYGMGIIPPAKKGFNAYDKIKNSIFGKFAKAGYDAYTSGREKRQAMIEAFPTAGKVDVSGLGASSITPGFGFASQATNRNAYGANQAAQAAIQAALANIKIQNAMLAQIKATKPNINLTSVNNSINTRLSRRA